MNRRLKKIWICSDVWMDILPFFRRPKLGLKMALLSPRFDALVDNYFDGKKEFTLWRFITIRKDMEMPKLFVCGKSERFPLPERPLPNKIHFRHLLIEYIDHSVIEFLRSNKQIWDRIGTKLELFVRSDKTKVQPIWDVFVSQIWPIFASNIRHLDLINAEYLDNLLRLISPAILTDLILLNTVTTYVLFLDAIAVADGDDRPTAATLSAGQALAKWLHTPTTNGQPKRLRCWADSCQPNLEWITNFKEALMHFMSPIDFYESKDFVLSNDTKNIWVCSNMNKNFVLATTSVSYTIRFAVYGPTPIEPFELLNEQTNEKLTLSKKIDYNYLLKRCPINGETAATDQWENDEISDANLNIVLFHLRCFQNAIGPLSPPPDKSAENVCSSAAGPSSDQRNE